MTKPYISLVLACYNEGPTFENSVRDITRELKNLKLSWEIIFVEDKSTDDTREKIIKISKKNKNLRVILHSKNQGRGKTVSDGIKASQGVICAYMDVDCEISPKYLGRFAEKVKKGSDVVVASRFYPSNLSAISRVITSKGYSLIIRQTLGLPIKDTEAGFKFFNRKKILPVLLDTKDKGWFWDTEICARSYLAGLKMSEIPVRFVRRDDKKSTVKVFSDSLEYAKKLWAFKKEFNKIKSKKAQI